MKTAAPGISPPTEKPCINLNPIKKTGAAIPIDWYVGRHPMNKVDVAIINMAHENANLRPNLSPRCPNTTPPNGRAKYPNANTANVLINPIN